RSYRRAIAPNISLTITGSRPVTVCELTVRLFAQNAVLGKPRAGSEATPGMPVLTSKGISLADSPKNLTAMALHVKIDKTRRLVTAHGSGEISDADMTAMEHTLENNPDFSP